MHRLLGSLEAEFTQFNITSSGDIQHLKDKSAQQDNQLKLQRKTIDDLSSDLPSQVQYLKDDLSQQSTLIKKLQEENQSLQKKNAKLSEANAGLLEKQNHVKKELAFLKEQIKALWQQSSITNSHQDSENVMERIEN